MGFFFFLLGCLPFNVDREQKILRLLTSNIEKHSDRKQYELLIASSDKT